MNSQSILRKSLAEARLGRWPAWMLALVVLGGCASQNDATDQIAAANNTNIKRLANLYQSYASRNGWQGPKDDATFRRFIQDYPAHRLALLSVDPQDLDDLYKSERDGLPIILRYGVTTGLGSVVPVAFEQQGAGGTRQVGFTDGSVQEVDATRYEQLLAGSAGEDSRPAAPQ